jgi:hypothetical protein
MNGNLNRYRAFVLKIRLEFPELVDVALYDRIMMAGHRVETASDCRSIRQCNKVMSKIYSQNPRDTYSRMNQEQSYVCCSIRFMISRREVLRSLASICSVIFTKSYAFSIASKRFRIRLSLCCCFRTTWSGLSAYVNSL